MAEESNQRTPARAIRPRLLYGAVVLAAASATIVTAWSMSRPVVDVTVRVADPGPPSCGTLPADLDADWNPARRRALLAGNPQATTSTAWLADVIDYRATAWPSLRRAACSGNLHDPAWSAALLEAAARCLAERRGALTRAIALEHQAADAIVAAAVALPDPRDCLDLPQLAAARSRRARLADVAGIAELTIGASAADRDGDAKRATQLSEAALAAASRLGQPLGRALALETRGLIELHQGESAAARKHLAAAYAEYRGLADPGPSYRAALKLAELAAVAGKRDEAERWLANARAESERTGATPDQPVEVALLEAQLLAAHGHREAAIAAIDRVLPSLRAERDPRYLTGYTRALGEKARLQLADGHPAEALATAHSGLIVQERIYGADHPQLLALLETIGLAERALGRHDEALATLGRAQQIATAHGRRTGHAALDRAARGGEDGAPRAR